MSYFAWKFASNMIKQNEPHKALSKQNGTDLNKPRESQNLKDSDINLDDILKLF